MLLLHPTDDTLKKQALLDLVQSVSGLDLWIGDMKTFAHFWEAQGVTSQAAPANVAISLSPQSATVVASGTQQFTATVSGTSNQNVTWWVNGVTGGNATVGTITSTGLYTAPSVPPSPSTMTITAISVADPTDLFDFGSAVVLHTTSQCTLSGNQAWVTEANKGGTVFSLPRGSSGFTSTTAIQNPLNPDSLGTSSGELIATPALIAGTSTTDCNHIYLPSEYGYLWNLQQAGDGTGNVTTVTAAPWPVGVNISGGCATPGNCPLFSAPAAVADVLVFGGGDGNLYVYTTSGTRVFPFGTLGPVASGPAISNGRIYFGSFDKNIYCLSVDGQ